MAACLDRRTLIAGTLGLAIGGARAGSDAGVQTLIAEPKTSKLVRGDLPTQHWNFRGGGSPPVLRARQGKEVSFRFINNLEEDIWLHLYGVRANASSVTALLPRGPAGALDLTFTPPDAGTFWIGPLLNAAKQREMGLYAMLIVEEADPVFEDVPILLDDWKLGEDGALERNFGDIAVAAGEGRLGNWYTVNGASKPVIALSRSRPSRLRVLNVSNARAFDLQLRGAEALLIAMDGQPVAPAPLPASGVKLAPGQRCDMVPAEITDDMKLLLDLGDDALEAASFSLEGRLPRPPAAFSLAANPWPPLQAGATPRTVPITLQGGRKGGLRSARVGGALLELRALLGKGLAWAINGAAGLGQQPLFEAMVGEAIILAIANRTQFDQPIAIDGHVWRELASGGVNAGSPFWRDTAVIPPMATASYEFVADNPGLWTLTSLVAERADAGLIGAFEVKAGP